MTYFPPPVFRLILEFLPTTKPARDHNKKIADAVRYTYKQAYNTIRTIFNNAEQPWNHVARRVKSRRWTLPRAYGSSPTQRHIKLDGEGNRDFPLRPSFRAHSHCWKKAVFKIVEKNCFNFGVLCEPTHINETPNITKIRAFCSFYSQNVLYSMYDRLDTKLRPSTPIINMHGTIIANQPLEYKTATSMKKFCKENGIKGYSKLKKPELAKLIMKCDEPYVPPYTLPAVLDNPIIGVECSKCKQEPSCVGSRATWSFMLHGECEWCSEKNAICYKFTK